METVETAACRWRGTARGCFAGVPIHGGDGEERAENPSGQILTIGGFMPCFRFVFSYKAGLCFHFVDGIFSSCWRTGDSTNPLVLEEKENRLLLSFSFPSFAANLLGPCLVINFFVK